MYRDNEKTSPMVEKMINGVRGQGINVFSINLGEIYASLVWLLPYLAPAAGT